MHARTGVHIACMTSAYVGFALCLLQLLDRKLNFDRSVLGREGSERLTECSHCREQLGTGG